MKDRHSLPYLSDFVGKQVRTNSESLIGVRIPGYKDDLSKGIAIGSRIYIDEHTHIEAVRYPEGSDAMSFLSTILTRGRPGITRIANWFFNIFKHLLQHPLRTVRLLLPNRWARECVILLCMQAIDGHINMRWKRSWWSPFRKHLSSEGMAIPTYIPQANEFAEKFAQMTGGTAMTCFQRSFSMFPEPRIAWEVA